MATQRPVESHTGQLGLRFPRWSGSIGRGNRAPAWMVFYRGRLIGRVELRRGEYRLITGVLAGSQIEISARVMDAIAWFMIGKTHDRRWSRRRQRRRR